MAAQISLTCILQQSAEKGLKKRTKINIGLLVLIALTAALLYLTGGQQPVNRQTAVSSIDTDSITRISVSRTDRKTLRFVKQDNVWRMLSPLPARANPDRINAILSVLRARSYTQFEAVQTDLGRFDLVSPAVILTLNDHVFRFGGSNPLEGRRYLLFQHTINLIDDGLYQQLQQPADFFIQPEDK